MAALDKQEGRQFQTLLQAMKTVAAGESDTETQQRHNALQELYKKVVITQELRDFETLWDMDFYRTHKDMLTRALAMDALALDASMDDTKQQNEKSKQYTTVLPGAAGGGGQSTAPASPSNSTQDMPESMQMLKIFYQIMQFPEYDSDKADEAFDGEVGFKLVETLLFKFNSPQERALLETILHAMYTKAPKQRKSLRSAIATGISAMGNHIDQNFPSGQAVREPWKQNLLHNMAENTAATLRVLGKIIEGIDPEKANFEILSHLSTKVLLPLHFCDAMLNDMQPLLQTFHEPLSVCLLRIARKFPKGISHFLKELISAWGSQQSANSPKEVLLLHELEQVLEEISKHESPEEFASEFELVIPMLVRSVETEFSRIAERALLFFSNERLVDILGDERTVLSSKSGKQRKLCDVVIGNLMRPLLREGTPHWSFTVNKMTSKVLDFLRKLSESAFDQNLKEIWGDNWMDRYNAYKDSITPSEEDLYKDSSMVSTEPEDSTDPKTAFLSKKYSAMDVSPTIIPELRFHDLVFGKVLGEGSFSVVMYAKLIQRGLAPSQWPEYAVKIIDAPRIRKLGYEISVRREVTILSRAKHPSISRLIATFRYKDGAYLVLEYGSKGDLHSHVTQLGSLSTEATRFIGGEIAAALDSVHAQGFAFGDCKPENVVLTGDGHAKLTDFGGVRPITSTAATLVDEVSDIIANMKDGDWRAAYSQDQLKRFEEKHPSNSNKKARPAREQDAPQQQQVSNDGDTEETEKVQSKRDNRIEGTAAYMSPELLSGERPSVLSDAWAFGCLLYFCVAGRPPFWADTEEEIFEIIKDTARRSKQSQSTVQFARSSTVELPEGIDDEDIKDLILHLLDPNPSTRLGGKNGMKEIMVWLILECV